MSYKRVLGILSFGLALFVNVALAMDAQADAGMNVQLIRNATVKVTYGDTTFLVDPMLAEPGSYPGFQDTYRSELRNPLTPLPMPIEDILKGVDAVILTHTHLDHWDEAAQKALPKDIPLFVQDEKDAEQLRSQGFTNVRVLDGTVEFGGVTLHKTECRHGSEAMFADKDLSDGFACDNITFSSANSINIGRLIPQVVYYFYAYIQMIKPNIIILNTGAAAMSGEKFRNDPYIIMGKEDTLRASKAAPNAKIVAVHMDAINHMTVDRKNVSEYAYEQGIRDKVLIPFDGEVLHF